MQQKLKPPCIRGLPAFKKGCPQRVWSERNPDGCPAWVETRMPTKGGTEFIEIAECLDAYRVRLQFDTNRLLEGNAQAVESFRNEASNAIALLARATVSLPLPAVRRETIQIGGKS